MAPISGRLSPRTSWKPFSGRKDYMRSASLSLDLDQGQWKFIVLLVELVTFAMCHLPHLSQGRHGQLRLELGIRIQLAEVHINLLASSQKVHLNPQIWSQISGNPIESPVQPWFLGLLSGEVLFRPCRSRLRKKKSARADPKPRGPGPKSFTMYSCPMKCPLAQRKVMIRVIAA